MLLLFADIPGEILIEMCSGLVCMGEQSKIRHKLWNGL